MQVVTTSSRFWLFWGVAFLGLPVAGFLTNLVDPVDIAGRAILAGAIAGAVLGWVQLVRVADCTVDSVTELLGRNLLPAA